MTITRFVGIAISLLAAPAIFAQAQVPTGATGQCKDGTYTTAAKKWQACSGHTGVKTWFADAKTPGADAKAATPPGAPGSAATPATAAAPAPATASRSGKPGLTPARTTAAPGGGPGLVWVNTSTNVYHCPGGKFYGMTKEGKYMAEADAKKAGAHADHNQPCSN